MLHLNGVTESNQFKSLINLSLKEVIKKLLKGVVAEVEVVEVDEEVHKPISTIEKSKMFRI